MKDSDRRTSDSLREYNGELKAGLAHGLNFTKLMDIMIYTDDKDDLLNSVQKLIDYPLDSQFIKFPIQYSKADFYLLFMNRLLEEHSISSMTNLGTNGVDGDLVQRLSPLSDTYEFKFRVHGSVADYISIQQGATIFALDFSAKTVRFNGQALLDLFLVDLNDELNSNEIISAVRVWAEFAGFMQADYGYQVDYDILAVDDGHFEAFRNRQLPSQVIDQLFISAAQHGFDLMAYKHTGAQLELDGVNVNIFDRPVHDQTNWGLQVVDGDNHVSWFQLLLNYDFLRRWYLDNLAALEIGVK
ncbi:hypothetical protein ACYATM_05175 [Lactobacillaceae bacterium Scapto_B20]